MRYWFEGEDEDYQRELERVRRFRGVPPAPVSPSYAVSVALLLGVQAFALMSIVVAIAMWLQ